MPTLTLKQKNILDYIQAYSQKNGYSPSHEEIRKHFKLASVSTVNHYMKILEKKGYIKRQKNAARAVEIGKQAEVVSIPFKGYIAAGSPIEAVEEHENITVPKTMVAASGEHFALGVKGDSMIDEGIFDGDTVIVRKQSTVENGETAVALINGNEVTLKKIFKEKNRIRLQPANPRLKPLYVKAVIIQGKVISTMRNIEEQEGESNEFQSAVISPEPEIVEQKPYFKKDNFTLYHANSLDFLQTLPENSIDMIFADPPYFLSNGGFSLHAGKRVSVDKGQWDASNGLKKDFEFHLAWTKACHRILKPGGTIWISGTYHSIHQCGFALQVNKFHILNDIAWFKPNASPNLSCRYFTASHETLIWARKDKSAKHKFNYGLMKNGDWPDDFIKKPGLQMRSVWAIYPPKKEEKIFGKHPTQKPIDLLNRIIVASTNEGDTVLDPFAGSSTTGLAAVLNDRKFIGVDTENKYLDLSIKRLDELNKNLKNKFI